ncbi:MAG TPA: hypothetical protein VKV03_08015 [Candidatus Binataceae bacterium]|nr:hypothetical protein [Candidatus Binataceae bacterium]
MSPFATLNPKTILSHARPGEVLAITVLAALVAHTMMNWLGRIAAPTTWDYGPAQLAVHVAMFARGAPLYRDFRSAPFIPLVYGPVVPILTAKLAPIFGRGTMAALEAGRVLTIASTLVSAVMIFVLARKAGAHVAAATVATLAFILSPIVLRWGFEYRVDMPALACELGGIVAFSAGASVSALVLFVMAFFIKQAQVVGIATVMLFCWISRERGRAVALGLIWLALVGTGSALLRVIYPSYFLNTFGAVRTVRLDPAAPALFFGILIGGSLGLTIFTTIALMRRHVADRLILCLAIVAMLHDAASSLRWGSNAYYFLPALAALTIIASAGIDLAFERMRAMRVDAQVIAGAAMALLLALGFIIAPRSIPVRGPIADPWDSHSLAILGAIDGPILTDAAELNLVDARPNLQWIDLMVLTSMRQIGTFDDGALVDDIRHRRIAAFALDSEGLDRNFRGRPMFWTRLRRAIEANYVAVPLAGPPVVMIPRVPSQSDK